MPLDAGLKALEEVPCNSYNVSFLTVTISTSQPLKSQRSDIGDWSHPCISSTAARFRTNFQFGHLRSTVWKRSATPRSLFYSYPRSVYILFVQNTHDLRGNPSIQVLRRILPEEASGVRALYDRPDRMKWTIPFYDRLSALRLVQRQGIIICRSWIVCSRSRIGRWNRDGEVVMRTCIRPYLWLQYLQYEIEKTIPVLQFKTIDGFLLSSLPCAWSCISMATAPPGYSINLIKLPSTGYQLVTTGGVCMNFQTVILSIKLLTRKLVLSSLGWDNFLIALAWLSSSLLYTSSGKAVLNFTTSERGWPDPRCLPWLWVYRILLLSVKSGFEKNSNQTELNSPRDEVWDSYPSLERNYSRFGKFLIVSYPIPPKVAFDSIKPLLTWQITSVRLKSYSDFPIKALSDLPKL
jgi:hypothetical protein